MNDERDQILRKMTPEMLTLLAKKLKKQPLKQVTNEITALPREGDQPSFPLSFSQKRLWFIDRYQPNSPAYNLVSGFRLNARVDIGALEGALQSLTARHEILRTIYSDQDGDPYQVILPPTGRPLTLVDLEHHSDRLRALIEQEALTPFSLGKGPMMRACLIRLEPEVHVLLVNIHHIAFDGYSLPIFMRELLTAYQAGCRGVTAPLAKLPFQFADFASWQQTWLSGAQLSRQLDYWRSLLMDCVEIELPLDRPRPRQLTMEGERETLTIDDAITARLQGLAQAEKATMFVVLLAAFKTTLYHYSGQEDLVVGAPFASRNHPRTDQLIGFFVNTLPLRTRFNHAESFRALIRLVRDTAFGAQDHQDLPFEKLVDELQLKRDPGRTPIYQTVFSFQEHGAASLATGGLKLEIIPVETATAKFDFNLELGLADGSLNGFIDYNPNLFDRATIRRFKQHLAHILDSASRHPESPLRMLDFLSEAEKNQLTSGGHGQLQRSQWTEPFEGVRCIDRLFEASAARFPDADAVVFEEQTLVYRHLNERSNQLAHLLREKGIGAESRVGIFMQRSPELIIAILAVLKAGAAYVPLDPNYPDERLYFIVEDSGTCLILADQTSARTDAFSAPVVTLPETRHHSKAQLVQVHSPENVAYIIYTSGSTGKPKGVLIPHSNVVRLFAACQPWFHFGPTDVWSLFHSYAFDFSVWEIWGALFFGGKLVIFPYETTRDSQRCRQLLAQTGVTVFNQSPSAFAQLVQLEVNGEQPPLSHLRYVIFGAEALDTQSLAPWYKKYSFQQPLLVNMYGITETTVHVTWRAIGPADLDPHRGSPVGVGIPDLGLYVVNSGLRPTPIGAPGEVFVGGAGLARGYLNRPALTAERFLPNPFSAELGARLYRTGDKAQVLVDGQLSFLGRVDHQVKLHGFRIEPGEISAAILKHGAVGQAVVLLRRDSQNHPALVAYIVARSGRDIGAAELRDFTSRFLPQYMVPAHWAFIEQFPRTVHGKLDVKALPEVSDIIHDSKPHYVPPATELEEALAAILAESLGVDRVGREDNYFMLGGDSIRSVRVLSLAQRRGVHFTLQQLFQHQTVRELAAELTREISAEANFVRCRPFELIKPELRAQLPEDVVDAYPMANLQIGMIFHMEMAPETMPYHNVNSWKLEIRADEARFREAVELLVARHEILRTGLHLSTYEEPLQLVHRHANLALTWLDIRHLSPQEQERIAAEYLDKERHHPFDLTVPTLLRITIHRLTDEVFSFSITECHAILDGWSFTSALTELFQIYLALLDGRVFEPSIPSCGYSDFIQLEQEALHSDQARLFWQTRLEGHEHLQLPRYRPPAEQGRALGELRRPIPTALRQALKDLAAQARLPLKSVLLAAHVKVLSLISGQQDLLFEMQVNGRPEVAESDRVYGLFLNAMPLRFKLRPVSWFSLIQQIFDTEWEALPYRRYPIAAIQDVFNNGPLSSTFFNFIHFHSARASFNSKGLKVVGTNPSAEPTHFPLTVHFSIDPETEELALFLQTFEFRLADAQLAQISDAFLAVMTRMIEEPSANHAYGCFLSESDRQQFAEETLLGFPQTNCLDERFSVWARNKPQSVATVIPSGTGRARSQLTYLDLEEQANQLANHLCAQGIGPGQIVGIFMERCHETLIATLAVLKTGAAYLPLDLAYPAQRLQFMLRDAQVQLLLVCADLPQGLELAGIHTLDLIRDASVIAQQPNTLPPREACPIMPAYVIYTSGSTGAPKGVPVTHAAVGRLFAATSCFQFDEHDVWSFFHSHAFDFSVWEIWGALLFGGRIVVIPYLASREPGSFYQILVQEKVTVLSQTPSAFKQLLDYERSLPAPEVEALRWVVFGGEKLEFAMLRDWFDRPESARPGLVNMYGITETTVHVTAYTLSEVNTREGSVSLIGKAIDDLQVHLLDPFGQRVGLGVVGEIAVAGAGLSRGYLDRPALTAQKFIPNPWACALENNRLYLSGDQGRYTFDQELEYLGRLDHQVKLRGFRIELGEIEAALMALETVGQAVVLLSGERDDQRLVAFLTSPDGAVVELNPGSMRAQLAERLPDYMVPSSFVSLATIPLTANGKVDRRHLLENYQFDSASPTRYRAPSTPVEKLLAEIWHEILKPGREIGMDDDFFDLGGHSLTATRVIARIRQQFQVNIELKELFTRPCLIDLANHIQEQLAGGKLGLVNLQAVPRDGRPLPLSFAQNRLWFLDNLMGPSSLYNMPMALHLHGHLDVKALAQAFSRIRSRHEALRTTFVTVGTNPCQVISQDSENLLTLVDISEQEVDSRALVVAASTRAFDLGKGPLLRTDLIRLAPKHHLLLAVMHHIVSDGWSTSIFARELSVFYQDALGVGRGSSALPELAIQYADYASAQHTWLEQQAQTSLDYWLDHLRDAPVLLALPYDKSRPVQASYEGAHCTFEIGEEVTAALNQVAHGANATLFMVLQTAFAILLARYSNQQDILVGTPIANRTQADVENLIGFFVNTLVLRNQMNGKQGGTPNFVTLLADVRQTLFDAYKHQDLPFEYLVSKLNPERHLNHHPIFQVLFSYQNTPDVSLEMPGLQVRLAGEEDQNAKFDLTLTIAEKNGVLEADLCYMTALFEAKTIQRMAGHLANLLNAISQDTDLPINRYPLMNSQEYESTLYAVNQTVEIYPDLCLHEMFLQQAEGNPDAIAIEFCGDSLTYAQLAHQANLIARRMNQLGVGPETVVATLLPRTPEMVAILLGILMAGGAFLPLDHTYPKNRIAFVLEDTKTPILVTIDAWRDRLPETSATVITSFTYADYEKLPAPPSGLVGPTNLVYVIYTSGSTGHPKGTLIPHRRVVNYLNWCIRFYGFNREGGVPVASAMAFDGTVTGFWGALVSGQRMILIPEEREIEELASVLFSGRSLSVCKITPAHMDMVSELAEKNAICDLSCMPVGGDTLFWKKLSVWRKQAPNTVIVNEYGPTETVAGCTFFAIEPGMDGEGGVPIGYPVANTEHYIVNHVLEVCPHGIPGELWVGAPSMARGYLNRPSLTASRFVPHPFSEQPGRRLYRTGDLARFRLAPSDSKDGEWAVEFLGRIDHQIKIRGYRVELGEIAACMAGHESLNDVAALLRRDNKKERLVGYATLKLGARVSLDELRAYMAENLPPYMVPDSFVIMKEWPLLPSGKLDRKALPEPALAEPINYAPPRDDIEEKLCTVWAEVLGLTRVGIRDNFFGLGGDSIMVIQIVSRVRRLGLSLVPKQMFEYQTIAELAMFVTRNVIETTADQGLIYGSFPLTPIAQNFFETRTLAAHHYNQSLLFSVREPLDIALLRKALHLLLGHHDALRLRYYRSDSRWIQEIAHWQEDVPSKILEEVAASWAPEEFAEKVTSVANATQAGMDLGGPLLRVVWFDGKDPNRYRLLIVVHHLAIDGVSWRILLEHLQLVYEQLRANQSVALPAKTVSVKVWAEKLVAYASSPALQEELAFWRLNTLDSEGMMPELNPPVSENLEVNLRSLTKTLSAESTQALMQKVHGAFNTEINDVLLTALSLAYKKWSGQDKLLIALEGHGREELGENIDLSSTVGWFTSVYPVLLTLASSDDLGLNLRSIKEQLRAVPERGIGYGILRYLHPDPIVRRSLADKASPRISFNYLGRFDNLEMDLFQPCGESPGMEHHPQQVRPYLLDITAITEAGRISLSCNYASGSFQETTIESLMRGFSEELEKLIAYCSLPDVGGFSPSDFPEAHLDQDEIERLTARLGEDSDPRNIESIFQITPLQQGLLYHTLLAPNTGMYMSQTSCLLSGALDVDLFKKSWQLVLERHGMLRSLFMNIDEAKPLQVIRKYVELPWRLEDWRELSIPDQEQRLEKLSQQEQMRDFDFTKAPLIRLVLARVSESEYRFLWTSHHVLLDGWSTPLIYADLMACYRALREQREPEPPPPPFRHFIRWLAKRSSQQSKRFWQTYMAGFKQSTQLQLERRRVGSGDPLGATDELVWNPSSDIEQRLNLLSREQHFTINTLFQAAWALLLAQLSGQKDIVFGTTVSGRPSDLPGVETMIGPFINTIPMRVVLAEDLTFLNWLTKINHRQIERDEHIHLSLVDIMATTEINAGSPLFETLLQFINVPAVAHRVDEDPSEHNFKVSEMKSLAKDSFLFVLIAAPRPNLVVKLAYDHKQIHRATGERVMHHFRRLIEAILDDPQQSISSLVHLDEQTDSQKSEKNMPGVSLNKLKSVRRRPSKKEG